MIMPPPDYPPVLPVTAIDLGNVSIFLDVSPSPDGNNKEPPASRIDGPNSINTLHLVPGVDPAIIFNSQMHFSRNNQVCFCRSN